MARFWQSAMLLLAVLMMAGQTAAQSAAEMVAMVPKCALPCVTMTLANGNCSLTNVTMLSNCLCTNVPLISNMSTCTQKSCPFDEQVISANQLVALCVDYPMESRVDEMRIAAIVTITVTAVVVTARCVARMHLTGRLWSDDWIALAAGVLLVIGGALELASAQLGFGLHFWDVYVTKGQALLAIFYAVEILYTWIKLLAKISIILLYMRLFNGRSFRWACLACMGVCAFSLIAFTFVIAFQCWPVESIWNRYVDGKCLDVHAIGYAGAVMSVVEDIVIVILPISELRKLHISGRKRIGVALMFALASFSGVTSMIRLKYLVQFSTTYDTTYDNVDTILWSLIELTSVVVCGSLPPLRPYLAKLVPSFLSSSKQNNSGDETSRATELSHISDSKIRRPRRLGSSGGFTELKEPKDPAIDERLPKTPLRTVFLWDED